SICVYLFFVADAVAGTGFVLTAVAADAAIAAVWAAVACALVPLSYFTWRRNTSRSTGVSSSSSTLTNGRAARSPDTGFFHGTMYRTLGNSRLPMIWVRSISARSSENAEVHAHIAHSARPCKIIRQEIMASP